MRDRRGSVIDRRSGRERRCGIRNIDYYWNGGVERRSCVERRASQERRAEWERVGPWYSVCAWRRPDERAESPAETAAPA